jgi:hypothetical protein
MEGERTMTFSCRFEPADWIAFYRHYLRSSWRHRRPRWRTTIAFAAVVALLIVWAFRDQEPEVAMVIGIIAGLLGSTLFFPQTWEHCLVNRFEATVAHPDNARKFGRQTMTITPEHLHVSEPGIETVTTWDRLIRVDRTQDHIFVYAAAVEAHIIPRASLEGPSFDEVWTKINQYLAASRPTE